MSSNLTASASLLKKPLILKGIFIGDGIYPHSYSLAMRFQHSSYDVGRPLVLVLEVVYKLVLVRATTGLQTEQCYRKLKNLLR